MKKLLLLSVFILNSAFLILHSTSCSAQNLIPNGDFELGPDSSSIGWMFSFDSTCSLVGFVNGPDFWIVTNGTPDRIIEGDTNLISWCAYDNVYAKSGKAYTLFVYDESGKTNLQMSLQKDSIYKLTYYASWETFQGMSTTPNRIEFRFNFTGNSIISPFISYSTWQLFDTTFIASNNSSELEIHTIEPVTGGVRIDSVFLEKINSSGLTHTYVNDIITIYPNPASDILNIKTTAKIKSVEVCDIYGKVLILDKKTPIHLEGLSSGAYLVRIQTEKNILTEKLLIQKQFN